MSRAKKQRKQRYRWSAPDGRRGRWRNTVEGALISAMSTYLTKTGTGVRVSVDVRIAEVFWPEAHGKGWLIEQQAVAP